MLTQQVAIVSGTTNITPSQLAQVAAAVQKQVNSHVAPIWGISAIITCFPTLDDIPSGYYFIWITDNLPGVEGYHQDQYGQPYAFVKYGPNWPVTVSHECIEMLVDPHGNRLVSTASPEPTQGRVNMLVEVCDPSESYSYTVNGIPVCDFYTPNYFDDMLTPATRYSYMGVITKPKQVLPGGYVSWYEPVTNKLWQQFNVNGTLTLRSFDNQKPPTLSMRAFIDSQTQEVVSFRDAITKKPVTFVSGLKEPAKAAKATKSASRSLKKAGPETFSFGDEHENEKAISKVIADRFRSLIK